MDDLFGLSSTQEIEFAIDLEPRIDKVPYKMVPSELKELKVQL